MARPGTEALISGLAVQAAKRSAPLTSVTVYVGLCGGLSCQGCACWVRRTGREHCQCRERVGPIPSVCEPQRFLRQQRG
eukprot:3480191-Pyramimonas_sp.AAC.1